MQVVADNIHTLIYIKNPSVLFILFSANLAGVSCGHYVRIKARMNTAPFILLCENRIIYLRIDIFLHKTKSLATSPKQSYNIPRKAPNGYILHNSSVQKKVSNKKTLDNTKHKGVHINITPTEANHAV